ERVPRRDDPGITRKRGDPSGRAYSPSKRASGKMILTSGTREDTMKIREKPADSELRQKLSREQYAVTQRAATEPPFRNEFWNNHRAGIYVDIVSGEPLFSSLDKFDSGCGWPSFTQPLVAENVETREDRTLGMRRIETR